MLSKFKAKAGYSLFSILILYYAIVSILTLLRSYYIKWFNLGYSNVSWIELFFKEVCIDFITTFFALILITSLAKKLFYSKINRVFFVLIHLLVSIAYVFSLYFVWTLVDYSFNFDEIFKIPIKSHTRNLILNINVYVPIYFSFIIISSFYYYFENSKKTQIEKSQLQLQLVNTKLSLLKSNLQPHFLFNTLNSISSLIEDDKKKAQSTIADLSYFLRDLLDLRNVNIIPLHQELDILQKFINIIEIRFSDHFKFKSTIGSNALNSMVPCLFLQPIIENSVKHGYSYKNTDLVITLNIEKNKNFINIFIYNNGKPLELPFKELKKGLGIKNVIERLETLYKGNYIFEMKNEKNNLGVITHIGIPYTQES